MGWFGRGDPCTAALIPKTNTMKPEWNLDKIKSKSRTELIRTLVRSQVMWDVGTVALKRGLCTSIQESILVRESDFLCIDTPKKGNRLSLLLACEFRDVLGLPNWDRESLKSRGHTSFCFEIPVAYCFGWRLGIEIIAYH